MAKCQEKEKSLQFFFPRRNKQKHTQREKPKQNDRLK